MDATSAFSNLVEDRADVLWRVKPIAAFLGLSEKAAQHRIDKGEIPTFRIGGTICARRSTLNAWLADMERKANPTPATAEAAS